MEVCPKCGSGQLTLRNRRSDGKPFYGCSRYPRCKYTQETTGGEPAGPYHPSGDAPSARKTQILNARGLYPEYNATFLQTAAVPRATLEKLWAGSAIESWYPHAVWRLDSPRSNNTCAWPAACTDVANNLLKIYLRGRITRVSPSLEAAIRKIVGASPSAPGIDSFPRFDPSSPVDDIWCDSEVERLFYLETLVPILGAATAAIVVPQAQLEGLTGKPGNGQRVDFLINLPGTKLVVELDDQRHASHLDRDAARDEGLRAAGIEVHRIPYTDLTNQGGAMLTFIGALGARVVPELGDSAPDGFSAAVRMAHQFQVSLCLGLVNGAFPPGETLIVSVHPPNINGLDARRLGSTLQAAADDLLEAITAMHELWGCGEDLPLRRIEVRSVEDDGDHSAQFFLAWGSRPSARHWVAQDIFFEGEVNLVSRFVAPRSLPPPNPEATRFFLEYIFGMPAFREGQMEALARILRGLDSIVLLPTGAGKSVIFQLAGFLLPGVTVIVAPLVSLMEDQLDNLLRHGIDRALAISKSLSISGELKEALIRFGRGEYVFTYIAPERFQMANFRESVRELTLQCGINLVAIDEAHCVSEWGHDFRTSYLTLGRTAREYCQNAGRPAPIAALTGTASHAVLRDVQRILAIRDHDAIVTPRTFDRGNLHFGVVLCKSSEKAHVVRALIQRRIPAWFGLSGDRFLDGGAEKNCGICFCPHVKGDFGVQQVSGILTKANITNRFYAGGLERLGSAHRWDDYKRETMQQFKKDQVPVLVATKAAGMGLDKPNIRFTVHYGLPFSIESFYQECGRAGRDGQKSFCTTILSVDHPQRANQMLAPSAGLEHVRRLHEAVPYESNDDVTRAMYFHVNAFAGVESETAVVQEIVARLSPLDQPRVENLIARGEEDRRNKERALLRLHTLGVVADYTIDYASSEFGVTLSGADPETVRASFAGYVSAYNRGAVRSEIAKLPGSESPFDAFVTGCCRVLVEFVYGTIEQGRRRALREMLALAQVAAPNPEAEQSELIRQRIIRYLETTYSEELERIVEADDEGFAAVIRLLGGYVSPDGESVIGGIRSVRDAAEIRGQVIRYLESQPDHPGLLLLRGVAEAFSDRPDAGIVSENLRAAYASALARGNVKQGVLISTYVSAISEIQIARAEVYRAIIPEILERLENLDLARELMLLADTNSEVSIDGGRYLFTRLSRNAANILTS